MTASRTWSSGQMSSGCANPLPSALCIRSSNTFRTKRPPRLLIPDYHQLPNQRSHSEPQHRQQQWPLSGARGGQMVMEWKIHRTMTSFPSSVTTIISKFTCSNLCARIWVRSLSVRSCAFRSPRMCPVLRVLCATLPRDLCGWRLAATRSRSSIASFTHTPHAHTFTRARSHILRAVGYSSRY